MTDPQGAPRPDLTHEAHVVRRFGAQAQAYVESAVHAQGADLEALCALLAETRPARLLDLGCGGGHVSFAAAPFCGQVTAYDLSGEMLEAVTAEAGRRGLANIATRQGSAAQLPFTDASFDMVVSRYSAHHWRSLAAGLTEARRVLGPLGRAVFMDVAAPETALEDTFLQSIELLRDPSHVRDYAPLEWIRLAQQAGFHVSEVQQRRLRLDFAPWVARIRTPERHVDAIRSLQASASDEVRAYFELAPDGSFTVDTATLLLDPV